MKKLINLDGDSLVQLDDGRIISFFFRNSYSFSCPLKIYDQKEFKEILSIELVEILKQNNKEITPLIEKSIDL